MSHMEMVSQDCLCSQYDIMPAGMFIFGEATRVVTPQTLISVNQSTHKETARSGYFFPLVPAATFQQ